MSLYVQLFWKKIFVGLCPWWNQRMLGLRCHWNTLRLSLSLLGTVKVFPDYLQINIQISWWCIKTVSDLTWLYFLASVQLEHFSLLTPNSQNVQLQSKELFMVYFSAWCSFRFKRGNPISSWLHFLFQDQNQKVFFQDAFPESPICYLELASVISSVVLSFTLSNTYFFINALTNTHIFV